MMVLIMKYQIDVLLLQESRTKWNTENFSKTERRMRAMDRESKIIPEQSNKLETTQSNYLLGGLLSIFFSKCSSLLDMKDITKRILGN